MITVTLARDDVEAYAKQVRMWYNRKLLFTVEHVNRHTSPTGLTTKSLPTLVNEASAEFDKLNPFPDLVRV